MKKKILDYKKFILENASPEELSKFFKDFMSGNTPLQKQYVNYKIDTNKIREMVNSIVLTDELKSELLKRKIVVPDVSKLKFSIEKTKYHRIFNYDLSDIPDEDEQRFGVGITIEVPFDESFEDDNTMITASIYIKNRGKLKKLFGYSNKRAQKDNEFNYYSVGSVLQQAYDEIFPKK
jgi:hypothetical protein